MYQKEYKILQLYLRNFKEKYYLREISKLTGISLRTVQRILGRLEDQRIIKSQNEGKNKYYYLNLQNIKTKYHLLIAEINKTLEFLDRYPEIKLFLKEKVNCSLIVFGSFARFKATKTSDLDILIIGKEPPFYLIPYKVHKIKLSKTQFENALFSNEPLIKEIIKTHIILTNHSYLIDKLWEYYGKT